jgi:hypothetical protein
MPATFGSISHGTLRSEDLLEAFSSELENRAKESIISAHYRNRKKKDNEYFGVVISDAVKHLALVGEAVACAFLTKDDMNESEYVSELIESLTSALEYYAPEYGYFGTNEGDGSDFGYWPINMEDIKEQVDLVISDWNEVPKGFLGEILCINERGNCTLSVRYKQGAIVKTKELWSIV